MPSPRPARPIFIAFLGYCLICNAGFALTHGFILLNAPKLDKPIPPHALILIAFVGPLLMAALGHFLLKGKNWARLMYYVVFAPYIALFLRFDFDVFAVFRAVLFTTGALLLALPGARGFFIGRALRPRRIVAKPPRSERVPVRSGRFEY